jgi:hypothetical protein
MLLVPMAGCQTADTQHGTRTVNQTWMRTELFFGLSTRDGTPISTEQWRAFLDHNISPRCPGGLTVVPAEGRWLNSNHLIQGEASRVVIILYPPASSTEVDRSITTVVSEYIQKFNQDSVLRGDTKERITIYTNAVSKAVTNTPAIQGP